MSLDTDHIVDRRRLRRKVTFWRVVTVLIAIMAVVGAALVARRSGGSLAQPLTPQISRVTIQGIIRGDHERTEALDNLARSRNTRAVIVHIDSPGGTTTGSEELHQALRRVAAQKPTVVVVDGMAASGGYMAAMAADICARSGGRQLVVEPGGLPVGDADTLEPPPNADGDSVLDLIRELRSDDGLRVVPVMLVSNPSPKSSKNDAINRPSTVIGARFPLPEVVIVPTAQ